MCTAHRFFCSHPSPPIQSQYLNEQLGTWKSCALCLKHNKPLPLMAINLWSKKWLQGREGSLPSTVLLAPTHQGSAVQRHNWPSQGLNPHARAKGSWGLLLAVSLLCWITTNQPAQSFLLFFFFCVCLKMIIRVFSSITRSFITTRKALQSCLTDPTPSEQYGHHRYSLM